MFYFYFSVYSEDEPDLNNELEISVSESVSLVLKNTVWYVVDDKLISDFVL